MTRLVLGASLALRCPPPSSYRVFHPSGEPGLREAFLPGLLLPAHDFSDNFFGNMRQLVEARGYGKPETRSLHLLSEIGQFLARHVLVAANDDPGALVVVRRRADRAIQIPALHRNAVESQRQVGFHIEVEPLFAVGPWCLRYESDRNTERHKSAAHPLGRRRKGVCTLEYGESFDVEGGNIRAFGNLAREKISRPVDDEQYLDDSLAAV